ncbi:MAG: thioredoxin-disulfide reductase [Candidatus Bathyarchaeota archaeon]|jgi:thioredoxin reductase (NADPH)|nr:thioredoxin-disulfide reductase [Candidatus Bathyarchaeota archaeon]
MYDVIILGSGPAGLTAAIYTSRARLKTLVAAGTLWGGQLMITQEVENFPGFENGILGPKLMEEMRKQAERFGAEIIFENATSADFKSKPFKVTAGNKVYEAKTVIIATGASPKWLGLENETRLRGRGVSVCATCDAPFFRNRKVVVVGGSDTAMEEAFVLSKVASEVKVIHRRDKLRASKYLQEKAFENPKITFVWNSTVQEILGKDRVEGVKLRRVDSGEESVLECDAVFLAIGHKPNTDIFKDQIELDQTGYIVARKDTRTNIEGVFVAGDAADYRYRQAIAAAGSGCKAALDVEKYLIGT